MKKLLLFLAVGALANTAMGQKANQSIVMQPVTANTNQPEAMSRNAQDYIKDKAEMSASRAAAKTTLDGKRLHSYLDFLVAAGNSVNASFPYSWWGADMLSIYSGPGGVGVQTDTMNFISYGTVLDPTNGAFNDPALPNSTGTIHIKNYNSYTVDSAYVYGVYGRNSTKTGIVDTMIISMVYGGPNIRYYRYGGSMANYGVDTVTGPAIRYDKVIRTADSFGTGNPLVVTKKILLDVNSKNDSTSSGLTIVRADFGVSIPADQIVAVTATFKSGEAYTPYSDTVFRGSVNSAEPFKYGLWRPAIYEQNEGKYPTYTPGNVNSGVFKIYGDSANGYDNNYVPMVAYINAETRYEFPDIDILLSCVGCSQVSVANVPNSIRNLGAYPNPANNELHIPFALENSSDVEVTLSSITGQVLKTQNMGNVSGGTAIFSTSDIANGMYIYTIKAADIARSGRITVAH